MLSYEIRHTTRSLWQSECKIWWSSLVGPRSYSLCSAQPVATVTKVRWCHLAWGWCLSWKAWSKQRRCDCHLLFMVKMYSSRELIYHCASVPAKARQMFSPASLCLKKCVLFYNWRNTSIVSRTFICYCFSHSRFSLVLKILKIKCQKFPFLK